MKKSPRTPRQRENARLLRATALACAAAALLTTLAVHLAPARRGPADPELASLPELPRELRVGDIELLEEQVYRDPENGFRIEFPAGWRVEPGAGDGGVRATHGSATIAVMVLDATTPEMAERVRSDFLRRGVRLTDAEVARALRAELDFGSFTPEQTARFVQRRLQKISAAAQGSRVVEEGVRLLGDRRAGYVRALSPGDAAGEVTNVLYFTLRGGKYYHVAAGALAERFDSLAPVLERSIRSFRLED